MKRLLMSIMLVLMLVSCGNNSNQAKNENVESVLIQRIDELESDNKALEKAVTQLLESDNKALEKAVTQLLEDLNARVESLEMKVDNSNGNQSSSENNSQLTSANAEATIKHIWDSSQGNPLLDVGDFDGKKPLSFVRFVGLQMMSDYEARATFITIWDCPVVTAYNPTLRCYSPSDLGTDGFENYAQFNKSPEGWVLTGIAYRLWDNSFSGGNYNMPIVR